MTADQPHPPALFPLSPDQLRAALEDVHRRSLVDVETEAEKISTARDALDEAVGRARAAGASWVEIARAAGMTREGARQRWSR
jgi:2,4-dienoyl-CoA reductase-like NADH-dependent reductase (Old Yellow Enzyme family)